MALLLAGLLTVTAVAVDLDGQIVPESGTTATVSSDTLAAAAEANVAVIDVLGAIAGTPLTARQYLIAVGELPPPVPPGPPYGAALARARCLIGKESGGLDIPNRQGSGAWGPGQYFPSTWARHTTLYRTATGYQGPLSLHSLEHVTAVMSWILAAIPSTRGEWSVSGCA
jgi:hypothetical protein